MEHLGSSAHFGLTAKAIREGKNLDALVGEIPGSRGHAPKIKASIAKSWGDIAGGDVELAHCALRREHA